MQVLHGSWIPANVETFEQSGTFCVWVESLQINRGKKRKHEHPYALKGKAFEEFLTAELGIKPSPYRKLDTRIEPRYFSLPTVDGAPAHCFELLTYAGEEIPEEWTWAAWQVPCYTVPTTDLIPFLDDLHFLFTYRSREVMLGGDLAFWYQFSRVARQIVLKDWYIPALLYQPLPPPKKSRKKQAERFQIHSGWEIASEKYEHELARHAEQMPPICAAGREAPVKTPEFWEPVTLLKHFSENLLHRIIGQTQFPAVFDKRIDGTLLYRCLYPSGYGLRHIRTRTFGPVPKRCNGTPSGHPGAINCSAIMRPRNFTSVSNSMPPTTNMIPGAWNFSSVPATTPRCA